MKRRSQDPLVDGRAVRDSNGGIHEKWLALNCIGAYGL